MPVLAMTDLDHSFLMTRFTCPHACARVYAACLCVCLCRMSMSHAHASNPSHVSMLRALMHSDPWHCSVAALCVQPTAETDIVMAYVVMAHIVMAYNPQQMIQVWSRAWCRCLFTCLFTCTCHMFTHMSMPHIHSHVYIHCT